MAAIDHSKPLAALVRGGTREIHDSISMSEGAKLLLSGSLSREEYARYLMMLWHVYESVIIILLVFFTDLGHFSSLKCS